MEPGMNFIMQKIKENKFSDVQEITESYRIEFGGVGNLQFNFHF